MEALDPRLPPENAPPSSAGSGSAQPEEFVCPDCGRTFSAKIGLWNHRKARHEGRPPRTPEASDIPVKGAARASRKELQELQAELAENIRTVGQVLHPLLLNAKLFKLQNPQAHFAVPGTRIDVAVPDFDTHLPYTLISRSELTAEVLVRYAETNETLLRWLQRFNSWFKGGEVGQLVGAHAIAAATSFGVSSPILRGASSLFLADVLEKVQAENLQLRRQLEQMQQQAAYATASDGRGAGN